MSESYVIVHRSFDPIQADHLGDILRDAGIAARVLGTRSAALVGVGQNIMQVHIEVPASQAGQATDVLEAYFEQDGELLLEQAGAFDEDSPPVQNLRFDRAVQLDEGYRLRVLRTFASGATETAVDRRIEVWQGFVDVCSRPADEAEVLDPRLL